jgi:UDPglucose 6-dehydrogenase
MLQTIYLQMCENKPPVQRMNFINAELTKISVNTYVTTKISYANMLADICDRLPGADVDTVTRALGADTRIGSKYLKGAMGYGGPCFPRDNVAFAALARKIGARADVAEATDRINNYQVDRLTGLVAKFAKSGTRIAILGLSYKPHTPVVEESHSVKLAAKLADAGYVVVVHDPLAQDTALAVLGDKVVGASSIEGAVRGSDLLIVATGWPEYKAIDPAWCGRNGQRLTVLDLWRTLPAETFGEVADVLYLGSGR